MEEKIVPINIKGIAKGLETARFGIFNYFVRIESGHLVLLRSWEYYVPELPKDLHINYPQGIHIK